MARRASASPPGKRLEGRAGIPDAAGRAGGGQPLKAMLDTNVFDLILADEYGRLRAGLEDTRSIALYISEVQLEELAAVPDRGRRAALQDLARGLCRVVAAAAANADAAGFGGAKHARDAAILAAAADRCDCLVTQDAGLRELARRYGLAAFSFADFAARARLG